jgi:NAD(P)-dependent dehydrogenase (short-subunit alcohol dehydrogenase family)
MRMIMVRRHHANDPCRCPAAQATAPAERRETREGLEEQLAVNLLAPHRLTAALLPLLRRAAPGARVVNVASQARPRPPRAAPRPARGRTARTARTDSDGPGRTQTDSDGPGRTGAVGG